MKRKVVVLMAPGFEEMELTITVDILRRAEIEVVIATIGNDLSAVTGSRGISMLPDRQISRIRPQDFDMVVLPGGIEGTKNLAASPEVIELIRQMHALDKYVAAICAAPAVLVKAGICQGRNATSHPAAKEYMEGVNYLEERVVKDGKLITSRAAGTTFEFAFALMKELLSDEAVQNVNKGVMARI
ncbi:MAG: DJ-1/PfpI family protein [Candidatus Rifleibacteriota bacterium]